MHAGVLGEKEGQQRKIGLISKGTRPEHMKNAWIFGVAGVRKIF
jgi:hypothetical protein